MSSARSNFTADVLPSRNFKVIILHIFILKCKGCNWFLTKCVMGSHWQTKQHWRSLRVSRFAFPASVLRNMTQYPGVFHDINLWLHTIIGLHKHFLWSGSLWRRQSLSPDSWNKNSFWGLTSVWRDRKNSQMQKHKKKVASMSTQIRHTPRAWMSGIYTCDWFHFHWMKNFNRCETNFFHIDKTRRTS